MSKNNGQTNQAPNLFSAAVNVIKAGLLPRVQSDYKYTFPTRETLHHQVPPHVQSVNEYLDKEGIDLHKGHIDHFKRGSDIDTHTLPMNECAYIHNFTKNAKSIKNETKIAASFHEEYTNETLKGAHADPRIKVYASVGVLAHTLFGAVKAAQNAYTAHEDDFATGVTMDYYRNCK
ncbi:hypothetical protein [Legionella saoudiensis]|uniref:hypothetical protein n=1 Tax=Legionella saoudiensis TaxID=1750561 RepID=UPI00072FE419|nr:hypothetical protein [Legionella saoudiensis]